MDKPILIIQDGSKGGGAMVAMEQLIPIFQELGYQPHIVMWNDLHFKDSYIALGATVYSVYNNLYTKPFRLIKLYNFVTRFTFRFLPKTQKYIDLLFQYNSYKKIIEICKEKHFVAIHLNNQPLRDIIGLFISKKLQIPSVCHVRSTHTWGLTKSTATWMNQYSNKYIAISDDVSKQWNKYGIERNKMHILHNPIFMRKNKAINPPSSLYEKLNQYNYPCIGYIGRFSCAKNVESLIKAAHKLFTQNIPIKLLLIGDGENLNQCIELAKELNIFEYCAFTGYQKEPNGFYKLMDFFVLPSRIEPLGRVTVEAIMHKVPVIASNAGGIKEVIIHNKTGLLYESDNSKELANSIKRLINNTKEREDFIEEAYRDIQKRFSPELYKERFKDIYKEIANIQ